MRPSSRNFQNFDRNFRSRARTWKSEISLSRSAAETADRTECGEGALGKLGVDLRGVCLNGFAIKYHPAERGRVEDFSENSRDHLLHQRESRRAAEAGAGRTHRHARIGRTGHVIAQALALAARRMHCRPRAEDRRAGRRGGSSGWGVGR